jgi:Ca-activated chloride channel family protein
MLLSLVIHVASIAVAVYFGAWVPRGVASSEGDQFRTVGLHLVSDANERTNTNAVASDSTDSTTRDDAEAAVAPDTAAPNPQRPQSDSPPVPIDLPPPIVGVIGPGPTSGSLDARVSAMMSLPGQPGADSGRGKSGSGSRGKVTGGKASFFGKQAAGQRIVYVVDSSGSMINHNAMASAKAELKASLQRLESTQQFQIIFYDVTPHAMAVRGSNDSLFWGNDPNRLLANRFIDSIQPDSGTNHIDALRFALRLTPDVIFFLTDADEPRLSGVELEEVRKRNGGKAQIHAIEFGRGADLSPENFLKKLARQNGGTHTYRDIMRFGTGTE